MLKLLWRKIGPAVTRRWEERRSSLATSSLDPQVLKLLRHNVELNCRDPARVHSAGLHVASLDWGSKAEHRALLEDQPDVAANGGFDTLLSSDCLYEPSGIKPMWLCVDNMLSRSPGARFAIAYEHRPCFKDLFDKFHAAGREAGFVREELPIGEFLRADDFQLQTAEPSHPIGPSSGDWNDLHLFVFRRKGDDAPFPPAR